MSSYDGVFDWHFGEIDSCQATMAEAIALAKEVNDMHGLAPSYAMLRYSVTVSVIQLKRNAWHQTSLNCQLVTILRIGWFGDPYIAVGRVALPVTPRKASR